MLRKVLDIGIRVFCQVQEAGLDGVLCDGRIHKGNQALQHLGNCEFDVRDLRTASECEPFNPTHWSLQTCNSQPRTLSLEAATMTGSMLLHSTSWLTAGASAATADRMVMRCK